jgi:hypothetical protein
MNGRDGMSAAPLGSRGHVPGARSPSLKPRPKIGETKLACCCTDAEVLMKVSVWIVEPPPPPTPTDPIREPPKYPALDFEKATLEPNAPRTPA